MELDELKANWQSNNEKLEKNIRFNEQNIELIRAEKVASKLQPLYLQRMTECIFHLIAIVLLLWLCWQYIWKEKPARIPP